MQPEQDAEIEIVAAEPLSPQHRHRYEIPGTGSFLRVNIADNTLVAPRNGRIAYRIANRGEVLAAGGKVFTMLDFGYVYMDIYLPTLDAGRVRIGDEAQFTPKMVETQTERDKLMFRVRVRIDPIRSMAHADYVRSGLPGVAYVLTDANVMWPERLQARS